MAGRGLGRVRGCLWRQCASRVHGERLRVLRSGLREPGARTAKMSASLVRATVRAVSKRKLQPTRAALTLTPSAVNKIKQLLQDKPEHMELSSGPLTCQVGLKVGVRTRGCNGLSYTLEYTKTKGDSDEEVVQDGVRVFIEKKAQLTLLGTEMDYVEDKLSSEFVFNNPNIKGTCGCGESFNI
ncbi:iron-sulfur cluster assembly 1 homolog, mitochondrial isoform X1 [Cavia porcellus]|uniref:iron-sulfur cluster assembly 1 homolog, mitochondrial isoform X1 n=1 Tax=Cavia porcellus TaxID=10141 RepID=UPI002FDF3CAC